MNKLLTKIVGATLGLTMAIGVGVAVANSSKSVEPVHAAGTDATEYVLITSTGDLETGKSYILTNGTSGTVKAISTASNTNNRKAASVTVSSSKITRGSSVMSFVLGGTDGAWTFETENYGGTDGYLASAASGNNNYLRVIATAGTATIAFNSNAATINIGPHSSRKLICFNSGIDNNNGGFACYSSQGSYGLVYLWKETASACSHNWVAGTVHAPTCTEQGYTEYTCSLCDDTKQDNIVAALGHDYGEWEITTPATCTATGQKTRVCSRDANHTETETIPMVDHNYVDGVCSVCGAVQPTYLVVLPSDGTAIDGGTTGEDFTLSKYCITIEANGTLTSDQARIFKNKTMTISGVNMKKIEFTCTAQGTSKQGPGCFGDGAPEGYTYDGYIGTWTGNSNSVSFTATDNQVRITEFRIYITAEGFASLITNKIACVSAGTSEPSYISGYSWSTLNTIYNALDATEKGALHDADADESGTAVEKAMAKYDYIVGKYNPTDNDSSAYKNYIRRTVHPIANSRIASNEVLNENNNTIIIVVAMSTMSIAAMGAYFLLRKRKEH